MLYSRTLLFIKQPIYGSRWLARSYRTGQGDLIYDEVDPTPSCWERHMTQPDQSAHSLPSAILIGSVLAMWSYLIQWETYQELQNDWATVSYFGCWDWRGFSWKQNPKAKPREKKKENVFNSLGPGVPELFSSMYQEFRVLFQLVWFGSFPGGSEIKNLPATQELQEMQIRSLGGEDPWRRAWQPPPVFLPGESHGQRSLVGYSP